MALSRKRDPKEIAKRRRKREARRQRRLSLRNAAERHWQRRRAGTANSAPQLKGAGSTARHDEIIEHKRSFKF